MNSRRYIARDAVDARDLAKAQTLRGLAFGVDARLQQDEIDQSATHILIEDCNSGTLVCCFRLLTLQGKDAGQSYSARFYDLGALKTFQGTMMELGRFCMHPDWSDPDILRTAWALMTQRVDSLDVRMLFGCSSFVGVEPGAYLDTFGLLKARHLAPARWGLSVKAPEVYRFCEGEDRVFDPKKGMSKMPPLLRTYLLMGGQVSDHAVIDRQMNTLHVFTGLEVGAIPASRKRLLRALV